VVFLFEKPVRSIFQHVGTPKNRFRCRSLTASE
jgi:hypothetical protein